MNDDSSYHWSIGRPEGLESNNRGQAKRGRLSLNRSELIEAVAAGANLPKKQAEIAVNTIFDSMTDALIRGERVEIRGFGSFTNRHYGSYTGRNPKTGDPVEVPPKRLPFFKVGKDLRDRVNES